MVWARLDDQILDNEKIGNAGVFGFALHVAAITWCCRNLTDGFIPRARVAALLDLSGVMWSATNPGGVSGLVTSGGQDGADAIAIADHNVEIGLWRWDEERRGYWLNDFLEYNPSREKVLAERERGRAKRAKESQPPPRPQDDHETSGGRPADVPRNVVEIPDGPVPDPVPVFSDPPLETSNSSPPGGFLRAHARETPAPESGTHTVARAGPVHVAPGEPVAPDVRAAWETTTMAAGKPEQPLEVVWLAFCGHYAAHEFRTRRDVIGLWVKWLTRQTKFDSDDRERAASRPRAGPGLRAVPRSDGPEVRYPELRDGYDESQRATPEQHRAFAAELVRRLGGGS